MDSLPSTENNVDDFLCDLPSVVQNKLLSNYGITFQQLSELRQVSHSWNNCLSEFIFKKFKECVVLAARKDVLLERGRDTTPKEDPQAKKNLTRETENSTTRKGPTAKSCTTPTKDSMKTEDSTKTPEAPKPIKLNFRRNMKRWVFLWAEHLYFVVMDAAARGVLRYWALGKVMDEYKEMKPFLDSLSTESSLPEQETRVREMLLNLIDKVEAYILNVMKKETKCLTPPRFIQTDFLIDMDRNNNIPETTFQQEITQKETPADESQYSRTVRSKKRNVEPSCMVLRDRKRNKKY